MGEIETRFLLLSVPSSPLPGTQTDTHLCECGPLAAHWLRRFERRKRINFPPRAGCTREKKTFPAGHPSWRAALTSEVSPCEPSSRTTTHPPLTIRPWIFRLIWAITFSEPNCELHLRRLR
jgi:hypothetical protein